MKDEKILITGPSGQVGSSMARYLARDNEVWALARFRSDDVRQRLEDAGAVTVSADLDACDLSALPDDFTYVVHGAAFQLGGLDFDYAIRINAESAGLVMQRFPRLRGFLATSSMAVYAANPDPAHPLVESDELGDVRQPFAPTYAISKICEEAVVRTMARALGIRAVVARLNCVYGPSGGLPSFHLDDILAGRPVGVAPDRPTYFSPIFEDDLNWAVSTLLSDCEEPLVTVNLAGDDTVTVEEWSDYLGELVTRPVTRVAQDVPMPSRAADNSYRQELLGSFSTPWRDGMRRMVDALTADPS